MSKRDATCYVDKLAFPKHLRRFFGLPPIIAGKFARACNLPSFDLKRYLDTTGDLNQARYDSVSCWPTCYSWSSFVAQSVLLKYCLNARLHFTSKGPLLSHRLMSDIDKALVDHGMKRNADKDVTGANGTAFGIDFVDGTYILQLLFFFEKRECCCQASP